MSKCAIAGMACPQTNDPNAKWFCPAWQPITWTNPVTGESKVINCTFASQNAVNIELIRTCEAPVSEIEAVRNEISKGFSALARLAAARVAQSLIEE
jgi:hypothetical protein